MEFGNGGMYMPEWLVADLAHVACYLVNSKGFCGH